MIHIVVPEGLNRPGPDVNALSDYYLDCLHQVARRALKGESVYLAPGNPFGYDTPEDQLAAAYLRRLQPELSVHTIRVLRRKYLDTLDNAILLRNWARQVGMWPFSRYQLYCTRFHAFRTRLCFRAAGFGPALVIASTPVKRNRHIVARLKYYDYAPAHICYEALATTYTLFRLAKAFIFKLTSVPTPELDK